MLFFMQLVDIQLYISSFYSYCSSKLPNRVVNTNNCSSCSTDRYIIIIGENFVCKSGTSYVYATLYA